MVKIENEIVIFKGEELGNLKDAEIMFDCLVLNGVSFPVDENPELKAAWDKLPKKPAPEVPKQTPQPTTEDYLLDFEYRLSKLELGV